MSVLSSHILIICSYLDTLQDCILDLTALTDVVGSKNSSATVPLFMNEPSATCIHLRLLVVIKV